MPDTRAISQARLGCVKRIAATHRDGQTMLTYEDADAFVVHDLDAYVAGASTPLVWSLPWPSKHVCSVATAMSRDFAVFAGTHAVRAIDADGETRWELRHSCWVDSCGRIHAEVSEYTDGPGHRYPNGGSVAISADGSRVWAHVRGPHMHEPTGEQAELWVVLDAATGTILAWTALDTAAQGSHHVSLPDGRMGLGIGEGQDGAPLLWGHLDQELHVRRLGDDEVLIDASPSGDTYLTVSHDQDVLTLRRTDDDGVVAAWDAAERVQPHPDGVLDDRSAAWDYNCGFIDETTVMASTTESDEEYGPERHWLIDVTSAALSLVDYSGTVTGPALPLGMGRWIAVVDGERQVWTAAGSSAVVSK